jgi:hypothetical protein
MNYKYTSSNNKEYVFYIRPSYIEGRMAVNIIFDTIGMGMGYDVRNMKINLNNLSVNYPPVPEDLERYINRVLSLMAFS